jgi:hypothetical protein
MAARSGLDVALTGDSGEGAAIERIKEGPVTREDDNRDTRISNWTLATGTLPGRRDVQAPAIVATVRRTEETTS